MAFIDRYMPGASTDEREEAYANFERFVAVLVRIDNRIRLEKQQAIRRMTETTVESERSPQPL